MQRLSENARIIQKYLVWKSWTIIHCETSHRIKVIIYTSDIFDTTPFYTRRLKIWKVEALIHEGDNCHWASSDALRFTSHLRANERQKIILPYQLKKAQYSRSLQFLFAIRNKRIHSLHKRRSSILDSLWKQRLLADWGPRSRQAENSVHFPPWKQSTNTHTIWFKERPRHAPARCEHYTNFHK